MLSPARPTHYLPEEIRQFALRHEEYGVKPEHYQLVADTLLWTLEKDWNTDVKEVWSVC